VTMSEGSVSFRACPERQRLKATQEQRHTLQPQSDATVPILKMTDNWTTQ